MECGFWDQVIKSIVASISLVHGPLSLGEASCHDVGVLKEPSMGRSLWWDTDTSGQQPALTYPACEWFSLKAGLLAPVMSSDNYKGHFICNLMRDPDPETLSWISDPNYLWDNECLLFEAAKSWGNLLCSHRYLIQAYCVWFITGCQVEVIIFYVK